MLTAGDYFLLIIWVQVPERLCLSSQDGFEQAVPEVSAQIISPPFPSSAEIFLYVLRFTGPEAG